MQIIKYPSGEENKEEGCAPTEGGKRLVKVKIGRLENPIGEFWVVLKKMASDLGC